MRILYINHYAGGPAFGMEYRPYYLAREWVRLGHQVTMVAASRSHLRSRQPEVRGRFTREKVDGIDYVWCETPDYAGNGIGRAKNMLTFLRRLGQWREWLEGTPDVVIASSTYPADITPARRIARRCGAALIWEVHDLWPLSPIELTGMSRWHPFALWMQWAENAACRNADVVVSMLPKVHGHLEEHGLELSRLVIVPNGISPEEWNSGGAMVALREDIAGKLVQLRATGRTVVGYSGSMGLPNALDSLLDTAGLMRDEEIEFVLVGDGHERQRLTRRIADESLGRVHWFPPIPKSQVPVFLSAVDICHLGWQRNPIYRFGIAPNKLMDYMMAARPVLHAVEAGNDPVSESGCGITVPPADPSAAAEGLRRLARLPANEREEMGRRGRAFVLANHAYPVLADKFLAGCRQAISGKRRS